VRWCELHNCLASVCGCRPALVSREEEWCGVDECPASICGGPHVEVSDGNLTYIVPIVEPEAGDVRKDL